jgi:hypothetical protein
MAMGEDILRSITSLSGFAYLNLVPFYSINYILVLASYSEIGHLLKPITGNHCCQPCAIKECSALYRLDGGGNLDA